jgi:hypothetical protein
MRGVVAAAVAVAADRTSMSRVTASAMKTRLTAPEQSEDGESPIARYGRPYIRPYTCCRIG